ncbi:leucine-rich repeat transmembrane protein kinase protein [Tanacetum coccineum]
MSSMNLSSSGLSGEIVTALADFTMIESLDLSYNNLGGTVPQFLASLDNLKLLNLTGNNFTRPLPAELLAKSKKRSLFLRTLYVPWIWNSVPRNRDVKPTNILLNEGFQAKLADFGMSRAFTTEDATDESTRIVGTLGYLDPE